MICGSAAVVTATNGVSKTWAAARLAKKRPRMIDFMMNENSAAEMKKAWVLKRGRLSKSTNERAVYAGRLQ